MRKVVPKFIDLPFGFRILVERISPAEMRDRLEDDLDASAGAAGFWDFDDMTIYIDKTLPMAKQRYILGHELLHAVHDWQHLNINTGVCKIL